MTSTRSSCLLVGLLCAFSVSQAAAQYPEQQQAQPQPSQVPYPQQQPQQPGQVPVTSLINQPTSLHGLPAQEPVASPSVARAGGFRLNIQGYAGFAGSGTAFFDGEEFGSSDLAPTFGLQVQGLLPIGDYVLLGPALSIRSGIVDGADERFNVIGADFAFGGHYAIALGDSLAIDPYVLFTLGLAVIADNNASAEDIELGLGFGFRAGATLWFADALGVSFGLGYQSAHIYPESFGDENAHARFHEIGMELGLALRFGE
ncbi:MAG: hypothetical protein ACI9KE_002345 [Polyangiales bacterium]|jgi:hypothetical protein